MRDWLKEKRNEKNLTMEIVAEKLGVSLGYYSMIENNIRQKKMDLAIATKLSAILDIPMSQIIENEAQ